MTKERQPRAELQWFWRFNVKNSEIDGRISLIQSSTIQIQLDLGLQLIPSQPIAPSLIARDNVINCNERAGLIQNLGP